MKRIRTLQLLLAAANVALAAALILFAALFLFVRSASDPGAGLPVVPAASEPAGAPTGALPALPNPLTDRIAPAADPKLALLLLGTLPNETRPERSAAFLRSGREEFVAFVGEAVGPWRLDEVRRDRAVFTDGRERREVRLEEGAARPRP